MRTTIELRDDQRGRLVEIAARRGQKGFSHLVQEAVDRFLEEEDRRDRAVEDAIGVLGTLSEREADALREESARMRERWR